MITSRSWTDLLASLADRGKVMFGATVKGDYPSEVVGMVEQCKLLLSRRGEASGHALSADILDRYADLNGDARAAFFQALKREFPVDGDRLDAALDHAAADRSNDAFNDLAKALQSPRIELLRRLNHARDATLSLVRMRADLLSALRQDRDLARVDADFVAVFSDWFNKGFLQLRRIDWQTPAALLEKIMTYEAVHGMAGWDELRARTVPEDRCIYGFFHPSLGDEPLVFIEVALMDQMPASIETILLEDRQPIAARSAKTAVFYSISNCQDGLRGIPLGSFLIKHVVEDLQVRFPALKDFVTLSPIPGFGKWFAGNGQPTDEDHAGAIDDAQRADIMAAAAWYLTQEKTGQGLPMDPVARFHLGNGARLERLNWNANPSAAGRAQSLGVMANYRYKLDDIEINHERLFELGTIASAGSITKLARSYRPAGETGSGKKPVKEAADDAV